MRVFPRGRICSLTICNGCACLVILRSSEGSRGRDAPRLRDPSEYLRMTRASGLPQLTHVYPQLTWVDAFRGCAKRTHFLLSEERRPPLRCAPLGGAGSGATRAVPGDRVSRATRPQRTRMSGNVAKCPEMPHPRANAQNEPNYVSPFRCFRHHNELRAAGVRGSASRRRKCSAMCHRVDKGSKDRRWSVENRREGPIMGYSDARHGG